MKFITSKEQFFQAEVYYPLQEEDWIELYRLVNGSYKEGDMLKVEEAAKYLLEHPDYKTGLAKKVRDLENNFISDKYWVDACPSIHEKGLYFRNGNKRSIAYAIKLLRGEKFSPVTVRDWQDKFTSLDQENLNGQMTTDDSVIYLK